MNKQAEVAEDSDDVPLVKRIRQPREAVVQDIGFWEYISQLLPQNSSLPSRVSIGHLWSSRIRRKLPRSWEMHLACGRPTEKTLLILLAYLCGNVQQNPCSLCSSNKTYGVPNNHGRVWNNFPFPFCVVADEQHGFAIDQVLKPAVGDNGKVCCNQLCRAYPASTRRAPMRPAQSVAPNPALTLFLGDLNDPAKPETSATSHPNKGQPGVSTRSELEDFLAAGSDSDEDPFYEQFDLLDKAKNKSLPHGSNEGKGETRTSEGALPSLRTLIALRATPRASDTRDKHKTPTKSTRSTNMARFTPMTKDRSSGMGSKFTDDVRGSVTPNQSSISTGRTVRTPRRQDKTTGSPFAASPTVQHPNMAVWEFAPGHLPETSGDPRKYNAISGAYLAGSHDVPIGQRILFRIAHMTPGLDLRFEPEAGKRRIIAVASGVLDVNLGDTAFQIGANGILKVEPNVPCSVMNMKYSTAVVHITTLLADN